MTREAEADRNLHDSVSLRLRETKLAASVPASVLRWEDTPLVPEKPHGPRKIVFAAAGAFFGFLAGVMLSGGRGTERPESPQLRCRLACHRHAAARHRASHRKSRRRHGAHELIPPPPVPRHSAGCAWCSLPSRVPIPAAPCFSPAPRRGGEILLRPQPRHRARHAGPPHASARCRPPQSPA